jgi:hypothetical protein
VTKLDWMGFRGRQPIGAIKNGQYYELVEEICLYHVYPIPWSSMDQGSGNCGPNGAITATSGRQGTREHQSLGLDHVFEMSHVDRRRVHNLSTSPGSSCRWQILGRVRAQWEDYRDYWGSLYDQVGDIDAMIEEFNREVLS